MMFKIVSKLIVFLSLFTVFLAGSASAQADDFSFKFRCLALNSPVTGGIYTQLEGGEPLRIYANVRTEWIHYVGSNPMIFYREVGGSRVPVGQFDLTRASEHPLLLFSRANQEAAEYTINSIDDSIALASAGSYRLFNFTDKDIAGKIDRHVFRVKPRESAFAVVKDVGDFEVTVQLAENAKSGPKRLYASSWTFSENFRYLVFILPTSDRTRGNIEIRLIPDLIQ